MSMAILHDISHTQQYYMKSVEYGQFPLKEYGDERGVKYGMQELKIARASSNLKFVKY